MVIELGESSLERTTGMSQNGEWKLDQLKCSICMETYRSPRILPCLHSFCTECLTIVLHDGEDGTKRICCPDCVEEHELPSEGVVGLPVNVYLKSVLDITEERAHNDNGDSRERIKCDLCGRDTCTMMSHCTICSYDLCIDCDLIHRRETHHSPQHKHSARHRESVDDGRDEHFEVVYCLFCYRHREKEAEMYCETCHVSVCEECTSTIHTKHTCVRIENSSVRDVACTARVLKQAKSVMNSLQDSSLKLKYTLNSLRVQNTKVSTAICDTIDSQMHALQEHKRNLLQQLEEICTQKEEALLLQILEIQTTLEDIGAHYSQAATIVKSQMECNEPVSRPHSLRMLEASVTASKDIKPVEDDYLKFYPSQPAGKCLGFEMMGRIDGVGPSPSHSSASGPGLVEGIVGESTHFSVSVCDRHGQVRKLGGDSLTVNIHDPSRMKVEAKIKDKENGVYTVSYTPTTVGEYRISVTIEGRNVKNSPFVVSVVSRDSRQHSGVYQCCTFCTHGKDKNVSCGCGGNMSGGFSGCGHGHPGHPGSWHWSCCGEVAKESMCSKTE